MRPPLVNVAVLYKVTRGKVQGGTRLVTPRGDPRRSPAGKNISQKYRLFRSCILDMFSRVRSYKAGRMVVGQKARSSHCAKVDLGSRLGGKTRTSTPHRGYDFDLAPSRSTAAHNSPFPPAQSSSPIAAKTALSWAISLSSSEGWGGRSQRGPRPNTSMAACCTG